MGIDCSFLGLAMVESEILGVDATGTATSFSGVSAAVTLSMVDRVPLSPVVFPFVSFASPSVTSAEPPLFGRARISFRIWEVEALAGVCVGDDSRDWGFMGVVVVLAGLLGIVVGVDDEECADVVDLLVGFVFSFSFNTSNFFTSSNTEVLGFCGELGFTSSTFAGFFADDVFFAVVVALVVFRAPGFFGASSISTASSATTFLGRPLFLTATSADMMDDVYSEKYFAKFLSG